MRSRFRPSRNAYVSGRARQMIGQPISDRALARGAYGMSPYFSNKGAMETAIAAIAAIIAMMAILVLIKAVWALRSAEAEAATAMELAFRAIALAS